MQDTDISPKASEPNQAMTKECLPDLPDNAHYDSARSQCALEMSSSQDLKEYTQLKDADISSSPPYSVASSGYNSDESDHICVKNPCLLHAMGRHHAEPEAPFIYPISLYKAHRPRMSSLLERNQPDTESSAINGVRDDCCYLDMDCNIDNIAGRITHLGTSSIAHVRSPSTDNLYQIQKDAKLHLRGRSARVRHNNTSITRKQLRTVMQQAVKVLNATIN